MILKKLIVCAFFFVFIKTSSAQFANYRTGFIIKQQQDTVRGYLLYKEDGSGYAICSFKVAKDAAITVYKPDQIIAYHFDNGALFETRKVTLEGVEKLVFAKILVKGRATLLKINNKFFFEDFEKQLFLLETKTTQFKDNTNTRIYKNELYKGLLSWKFADCSNISEEIQSTRLDHKGLTKLFELYNGCFQEDVKTPRNKQPWSVISAGISAGIIMTKLNIDEEGFDFRIKENKFNKDISASAGASFNFRFPRISERIQFNLDVLYQEQTFESQNETPFQYQSFYFKYNSIQFPLSALYTLTHTKIKPALEIGISPKITVNASSLYTVDDLSLPGSVYLDRERDVVSASSMYMFPFVGLGISSEVKTRFIFSLKCRYHYAANAVFVAPVVQESGWNVSMSLLHRLKK